MKEVVQPAPTATGSGTDGSSRSLVSILIVNWNTREHLARCLEGLTDESVSDSAQIIVVDNASTDGSADMVEDRFPQVCLVRNEANLGFASAVNQAASQATGDLLLLLNSDTVLGTDTIATCREFILANADVAVVGCRLEFPDGSPQSSAFRFPSLYGTLLTSLWLSQAFPDSSVLNWNRYGNRRWDTPQDVDVTMGSFLLLRHSALNGEVPLDEGYFMYGEECDMCRRLLDRGWRTVHLPSASLIHVHGGSTKTPQLEGWATEAKARGILRYLWKWRGAHVAWLANLLMLLGLLPRVAAWALTDLARGMRLGSLRACRLQKARVVRFHCAAVIRPKTLQQTWSGPRA